MKISKKVGRKTIKVGEDIEIDLREYAYEETRFDRGAADFVSVQKSMFLYCIEDWRGIIDEDTDKPFECTKENKLYLFNYEVDLRNEILNRIYELAAERKEKIKNSSRSQNGKETEQNSNVPTATEST